MLKFDIKKTSDKQKNTKTQTLNPQKDKNIISNFRKKIILFLINKLNSIFNQ